MLTTLIFPSDGDYYYLDSSLVPVSPLRLDESDIVVKMSAIKLEDDRVIFKLRVISLINKQWFSMWSEPIHLKDIDCFPFETYINACKEAKRDLSPNMFKRFESVHAPVIVPAGDNFRLEFKVRDGVMYDVGLRDYRVTSVAIESSKIKPPTLSSVAIREI